MPKKAEIDWDHVREMRDEGWSWDEIAEEVGVSRNTVANRAKEEMPTAMGRAVDAGRSVVEREVKRANDALQEATVEGGVTDEFLWGIANECREHGISRLTIDLEKGEITVSETRRVKL